MTLLVLFQVRLYYWQNSINKSSKFVHHWFLLWILLSYLQQGWRVDCSGVKWIFLIMCISCWYFYFCMIYFLIPFLLYRFVAVLLMSSSSTTSFFFSTLSSFYHHCYIVCQIVFFVIVLNNFKLCGYARKSRHVSCFWVLNLKYFIA